LLGDAAVFEIEEYGGPTVPAVFAIADKYTRAPLRTAKRASLFAAEYPMLGVRNPDERSCCFIGIDT
jgi:hypothetical protein